jgi:cytochrome c oxidase accessory protein FixG
LGDCVDCTLCVQVCPTGIDIRKGLQYECIGCAACIDVCNGVMKKLDYAPGLIRYSTQQALVNGWSNARIWQRLSRPRVLVYLAIWVLICAAWLASLSMRHDFRVDVVRDRTVLARIVTSASGGMVENVYRAQLMNASDRAQQLQITASGLPGLQINGAQHVDLEPIQSKWVVLRLDLPAENAAQLKPGSHPIELKIYNSESGETVLEKSAFYIPR